MKEKINWNPEKLHNKISNISLLDLPHPTKIKEQKKKISFRMN